MTSLVVLEVWPWPRGSSRTPHEGLGLGLGLENKVLVLTSETKSFDNKTDCGGISGRYFNVMLTVR